MTLKPSLSAYLDALRFLAALAVLLGHMDQDGLSTSWMPLYRFSHEAVVVFFVLSGFIIHHSTSARASSWRLYLVARLSRVYSVALPAVVFCTLLAVLLGRREDIDLVQMSNYVVPTVWGTVSSLLFLNSSWLNTADLTLNNPYWSLCYEVWFYALFGAYFFTRRVLRWLLVSLIALGAGPAILVLLPIWLSGAVLAASGRYQSRWSSGLAWTFFLLPLALIILINISKVDFLIQSTLYENVPGYWRLVSSQRFLTDYLIGTLLCLHITAFSSLPVQVQEVFSSRRRTFAGLAGFSFSLYLFHRPFTQIVGAYFPVSQGNFVKSSAIVFVILLTCWVISRGTERQLPIWRRQFARVLLR